MHTGSDKREEKRAKRQKEQSDEEWDVDSLN